MIAVTPAKDGDVHCPAGYLDLGKIFCIKDTRQLQNDFTLSYKTRILQLTNYQQAVVRSKEIITFNERFDGTIGLFIRGINFNHKELEQRPIKYETGNPLV